LKYIEFFITFVIPLNQVAMSVKKIFRQDYSQTKSLVRAANISGRNAVRRSKALDLTITYIEDGIIYEELPDGTKKAIGEVEKKDAQVVLVKGMVLHGK
jgi:hypothetical protein